MDNVEPLNIKGAKGKVEIVGVHGIFYKVALDGVPLKRTKGSWEIPLRSGGVKKIHARGILPGFQKLFSDGEELFDLAAHVPLLHKILVFLPLLLVFVTPYLGAFLGIVVVFLNIFTVKNAQIPFVMRTVTPIINTLAAGMVLYLLVSSI